MTGDNDRSSDSVCSSYGTQSNDVDPRNISIDDNDIPSVQTDMLDEEQLKSLENLKVAADPKDISDEERKRNVKKLAGAISHSLRLRGEINVRAFGSAAIGKATKALGIAKKYIEETDPDKNLQLAYSPAFITTRIGETTLTGICFVTFTTEKMNVDTSRVKSILKVTADDREIDPQERRLKVRKLAGAISHAVEENKECLVRCFGNASIAKACKALAISRGFTATRGSDLYCFNDFIVTKMGDNERTGISFFVFSNET
jgi:stage V sporulation protein S